MDNIRHIHLRRRWIFSGVFALLLTLMGVWLLLPAFSAHAAPVKAATGHETVTCIVTAEQKTPKCTGGQGTTFCTGGPATSEKVGKEQGITDVVGKEQLTIVKGTKGQGPPITCTAGKAATGHETVTCIVTAGQKTPKCTGGQGTIFCTGGPATSEKVGKEQGITDVVGKEQLTIVKGTKGQGPPITCTAGKK